MGRKILQKFLENKELTRTQTIIFMVAMFAFAAYIVIASQ